MRINKKDNPRHIGILSIKPTPIQEPSVNPSQVIYDYILCFTHCFVKFYNINFLLFTIFLKSGK
nr:MAG TPA: hypothetical protein [Caudoviricetes sp.]DAS43961.1 MAG TPA: hypothetical protein [Caudoviricetes sp.]